MNLYKAGRLGERYTGEADTREMRPQARGDRDMTPQRCIDTHSGETLSSYRRFGRGSFGSGYSPPYIFSMTSSYFSFTTFRLTLRLGVNSPVSMAKGVGMISNFFTFS